MTKIQLIKFKRLKESDLEQLCLWFDKPHVKAWWNDGLSHSEIKEKYRRRIGNTVIFPFIVYFDGNPIGFIQYYWANKVGGGWWEDEGDKTVGLDLFIGEEGYLNRGVGTDILKCFIIKLMKMSDVNKIIIDVELNNLRALRCYQKAGFHIEKEMMTPEGLSHLLVMKI